MFETVKIGTFRGAGDALVVGHFKDQAPDRKTLELDRDGSIAAAAKRTEATGDVGRIAEAFPGGSGGRAGARRVLIVGLGAKEKFNPGVLRDVAAAVGRRLAVTKDQTVEIALGGALASVKADAGRCGVAFGEGLGLISWVCDDFKGSASKANHRQKLTVHCADAKFAGGMEHGMALAESANIARTLSHTPPNVCTPMYIAGEAQKMCRKVGLSCTVFKGEALKKERFTGLINVGQASEFEPCMIRMEYRPKGSRGARPIVLIGKTMTYDSGGLSLKVNNGMRGMKRDKDGGCAVFGAMHAIATVIKPKRPVVALLACAENSISDEAYRPDDVITYRNGVTVEVTNTDAEGRLVLADALCWATEKEDPASIVDLATLTGGVVVALGSTYAGMFCDDDKLRAKVEAASERSGERVWRLPLHQEYLDMMKSDIADIINSNPDRKAHPIQGAAFLKYFVPDGTAWCHLDIAGVHAVEGDKGPFVKSSATGWGVRLLAELLDGE